MKIAVKGGAGGLKYLDYIWLQIFQNPAFLWENTMKWILDKTEKLMLCIFHT